jgi:hypothetical protein
MQRWVTAIGDIKEPFCHFIVFSWKNSQKYKRVDINVFSVDQPCQCWAGVHCFRDCLHHQLGFCLWLLCSHVVFIQKAVIWSSLDHVRNREAVYWVLSASSITIASHFHYLMLMTTHFAPPSLIVQLHGILRYTGVSTEFLLLIEAKDVTWICHSTLPLNMYRHWCLNRIGIVSSLFFPSLYVLLLIYLFVLHVWQPETSDLERHFLSTLTFLYATHITRKC